MYERFTTFLSHASGFPGDDGHPVRRGHGHCAAHARGGGRAIALQREGSRAEKILGSDLRRQIREHGEGVAGLGLGLLFGCVWGARGACSSAVIGMPVCTIKHCRKR